MSNTGWVSIQKLLGHFMMHSKKELFDYEQKFQKSCIELVEFFVVCEIFDLEPTMEKEIE